MKQTLFEHLKPFGQEHLLTFWDELNESERKHLAAQIADIDFALIADLYRRRNAPVETLTIAGNVNDPPGYKFSTVTDPTPCRPPATSGQVNPDDAVVAGSAALLSGKVGFALVAGGQGTRLGFCHPKGMYPIGPVSDATLFQFHFEKILAITRRYGHNVPYCIMTSPATHAETVEYLARQNYFGLATDDVFIFCQGTMPAVSIDEGKVLLDSKSTIALSPDGHGGMLSAMSKGMPSILTRLRDRGIEYLFYHQVDNPLVRVGSPEFLGYHILSGSELTSQVIRKKKSTERVGNIVEIEGRLHMIEYSDLPETVGKQTHPDGSLKIWAGSIAVHVFNRDLLERASKNAEALPFHYARKKVPHVVAALEAGQSDQTISGQTIRPAKENAIKFERFIFDLLSLTQNSVVVEVDPPNHYSPLKNAPGSAEFSPETVKRDISAMHTSWFEQTGAVVPDETLLEISPLFADSPEILCQGVKSKKCPPAHFTLTSESE